MTQLGLDLTPHRTHAGDPASSHLAEARLRKSGQLSGQQRAVLAAVVMCPGSSSSRISNLLVALPGAELFDAREHQRLCQVRRRLSDLCTTKLDRVRRHHTPGENESRWFHTGDSCCP